MKKEIFQKKARAYLNKSMVEADEKDINISDTGI